MSLRDMFQTVFDLKKKEAEMKGESIEQPAATSTTTPATTEAPATTTTAAEPSLVRPLRTDRFKETFVSKIILRMQSSL